jgi:OmcA/MtrC family decaheme c-type cytochrome
MLNVMNPAGVTATAVAYFPGGRTHDAVSDQACVACHGNLIWRDAAHDVTYPQGVGPCIVCHNRVGSADPRLPGAGSGLMGIAHGIHNSANMPDKQYTFTWTNGNKFNFSVGFPGYMNNCSTCHDSSARLAAVAAAPVSYELCISCHDDFSAFVNAPVDHAGFSTVQVCTPCHSGRTAASFHNGQMTERSGLIWDGADQSVVQGKRVAMSIDSVAVSGGTTLVVTWSAKLDGVAVDPCNQTVGDAAPVFFGATANATTGQAASNLTFLRAYGQANDWVNGGLAGATSPGQPAGTVTPSSANTTCASNVATSTFAAQTTTATRGIVALQGKPQIRFAPAVGTKHEVIQIRSATPTREFVVASGALPAASDLRREIVSVAKCNGCHVGSLYQHGGNRVDSIELCVTCHNPASNEGNNRLAMGVGATAAYDGKVGETYDLRYMTHAIHSAGESGQPLVYYRSNGIYFFGSKAALAQVTTWPTTGGVTCKNTEGLDVTYYKVFGSAATGTVPEANTDGTCKTTGLVNSTDGTWRIHNFIEVHYPRLLNDCAACHVNGTQTNLPDPTRAVAVTYQPGAAPFNNLLDDVLIGPSAATCMSCHQSGDVLSQFFLRKHAYDGGWWPSVFPNGRQTLLDAVP